MIRSKKMSKTIKILVKFIFRVIDFKFMVGLVCLEGGLIFSCHVNTHAR